MINLERPGIHPEVRSFFEQSPQPIYADLWMIGTPLPASDLFICSNLNDAIAWLNLNRKRYRHINELCFITIGTIPQKIHAEFIQHYTPKKKLHFLFEKSDLGALCDLKLASFIRNKPLTITYDHHSYLINFENKIYQLERLSLHALEKASGYNFRIRTHKPRNTPTYHEQHRNRH